MHLRAAYPSHVSVEAEVAELIGRARNSAAEYVEAFAACGGYPLHLRRWDPGASPEENLRCTHSRPAGFCCAMRWTSENLDWRGGYKRVLGALGAGTRRRSRIASRAQQRIDYTLDRLRRAGYVRAVRPHGSPATADPLYEIMDPVPGVLVRGAAGGR